MKRTTIIDIAKATGYSKSTVSRVLRGGDRVRNSTRSRILNTAKRLNYSPNEMARSLVTTKSSDFIGMIVSDINNQWYVAVLNAFERALKGTPYSIILCNSDYDILEERRYIDLLIRNRASGIVFAAPEKNDESIKKIIKENIPFVVIGTEVNTIDVDVISVDNYLGAKMAVEYLINNGHKDILHFSGKKNFYVTDARIKAFKDVMLNNNLKITKNSIIETGGTITSGYLAAKKLRELSKLPTAIFAYCDYVAMGIWEYLSENNIKVPEDISIIGFDDIQLSSFFKIKLTTIKQPFKKIGEKAVEVLEEKIKKQNDSRKKIYIKPELIERATVLNLA